MDTSNIIKIKLHKCLSKCPNSKLTWPKCSRCNKWICHSPNNKFTRCLSKCRPCLNSLFKTRFTSSLPLTLILTVSPKWSLTKRRTSSETTSTNPLVRCSATWLERSLECFLKLSPSTSKTCSETQPIWMRRLPKPTICWSKMAMFSLSTSKWSLCSNNSKLLRKQAKLPRTTVRLRETTLSQSIQPPSSDSELTHQAGSQSPQTSCAELDSRSFCRAFRPCLCAVSTLEAPRYSAHCMPISGEEISRCLSVSSLFC